MRKSITAAGLAAALFAAPLAIAEEPGEGENTPMMMGEENMSGMMEQGGGMMGMMQMMQQMSEMMETCNNMMQATMEDGGMMPDAGSDAPEAEGDDG